MKPVLDFVKAHTFALGCALLAIVGLIAYFIYPIPGMFADLGQKVEERSAVFTGINGLLTESRTLPNVDIAAAEPQKLAVFPTNRVVEAGKKLVDSLADEAERTLAVVVQRNQRQPLVPDALPNGPALPRRTFLDRYRAITAQSGDNASNGVVATVLHGSFPPSPEEVKQIGDKRAAQITQTDLVIGANNQPVNQPEVEAKIQAMRSQLPLKLRLARAYGSQIYVSPGAVEIHPSLQSATVPDVITVFNGQLSLWLQQTCFEAIAAANGSSKNVFESPVKQLIRLTVPMSFVNAQGAALPGFGSEGGDAAAPAGPVELKPDATAPITPSYATNPLGYTHNAFYDPIPVQMVLRVEVAKLPTILNTLQTGRLLKVKNVQLRTVDLGRAIGEGYIYYRAESQPLVDVQLDCDVLFLRQWLVKYMPDAAKRYFATLGTPGAAPQG